MIPLVRINPMRQSENQRQLAIRGCIERLDVRHAEARRMAGVLPGLHAPAMCFADREKLHTWFMSRRKYLLSAFRGECG